MNGIVKRNVAQTADVVVSTAQELDVKEVVKARLEKAIQEVVDLSSKEFYRTITVSTNIEVK